MRAAWPASRHDKSRIRARNRIRPVVNRTDQTERGPLTRIVAATVEIPTGLQTMNWIFRNMGTCSLIRTATKENSYFLTAFEHQRR